ncbi:WD40-repeat-containing domain [Pseudocohnilembus persalinus]|uniref:WD40-repeat-containing domain n=1 Tax=Pseudocohnilembus persalinus TaxID=266149 RepID=A0A0V0Q9G5_PSEPJ|nr:WD40-repeat-containing domain [Pseudocohnilembus persalinus]|eukprot:KRW98889.1 WD40-repeat-containing domain [Pseudocohnilembus persalinus]
MEQFQIHQQSSNILIRQLYKGFNNSIQQSSYFNKEIRCQKHDLISTMICLVDKCQNKVLCQKCINEHTHGHLTQVMPLKEFNKSTNLVPSLIGHKDIVTCVCLIDYNRFASASGDQVIKIWNIDEQNAIGHMTGHQGDIWELQMISDKLIASCSSDQTIKIWDIDQFKCMSTLISIKNLYKNNAL